MNTNENVETPLHRYPKMNEPKRDNTVAERNILTLQTILNKLETINPKYRVVSYTTFLQEALALNEEVCEVSQAIQALYSEPDITKRNPTELIGIINNIGEECADTCVVALHLLAVCCSFDPLKMSTCLRESLEKTQCKSPMNKSKPNGNEP